MKKRSRVGGKPAEARRRKTPTPKRRNSPKVVRRSSSVADQETNVARLTRERDEALEQQTATSDVLQVTDVGSRGKADMVRTARDVC